MNLIFYSRDTEGVGEQLRCVIEAIESPALDGVEIHRTIDSLSRRLRQPSSGPSMAVLLAASKEDLMEFLSIHDLLDSVRIILVLPDRKDDTVAKGHSLRPRFLTYVDSDSDFLDVAAVLSKMLGNT